MAYKPIHELWAHGKLSHDVAREIALQSRCMGADRLCHFITWTEERELAAHLTNLSDSKKAELESRLASFKTTETIVQWQRQYCAEGKGRLLRFKPLLLQGRTQSGKTRKAISIFGHARTLVVNCQGLGVHLPSLKEYSAVKHSCIVFDEVSSQQVLANKLVFQAGVDAVTLGQSACNAHAYQLWLFGVPMILCSNDFQMRSREKSVMSAEDEEYLASNVIDGSLKPGEVWYSSPPQLGPQSESESEADDIADDQHGHSPSLASWS